MRKGTRGEREKAQGLMKSVWITDLPFGGFNGVV